MKPVLLELDETAARLILAALSVVHAQGWAGVGVETAHALDARADALRHLILVHYPALAVEYPHLYPG